MHTFGDDSEAKAFAEAMKDKKVQILYNPSTPDKSDLDPISAFVIGKAVGLETGTASAENVRPPGTKQWDLPEPSNADVLTSQCLNQATIVAEGGSAYPLIALRQ